MKERSYPHMFTLTATDNTHLVMLFAVERNITINRRNDLISHMSTLIDTVSTF